MLTLALALAVTTVGWTPSDVPPVTAAPAQDAAVLPTADQRAVLITGASTGIGRVTAEHLAANGFYVYAGARKDKDLAELSALENIEGIRLDVTIQEEIDAAVETVKAGGRGLYGLINNAGVGVVQPLIEVSEDDFDFQMDVNLYGPYRVTAAFAPMLIESGGRISTTGSISGVLPWPLGGPYCMSKHAVEAFTDVLAMEMAPFGVSVSVVEPGNYESEIGKSHRKRLLKRGYSSEGSLFKEQMDAMLSEPGDRSNYKDPVEVAEAFHAFLTDEQPKRHYMVVPNETEAAMTLGAVVQRLVQLNDDQPYTYTRDELVAMLDAALAAQQR